MADMDKEMKALISKETINFVLCLEKMRYKPRTKSKLQIPLCRMISLPIVRPYLKNDVMNLGSHFLNNGYMEGNGVFYVALENHEGMVVPVTIDVSDSWSPHWKTVNDIFEKHLLDDEDLQCFSNKMFHVWDGNHRLQAWLPIINGDHSEDMAWHCSVESIILEVKGSVGRLVSALHQVNRYAIVTILF